MNKVEAFKNLLRIYSYIKKRPRQLENQKEDSYDEMGGIKPVNLFGEIGTTNPAIKEYRRLDICDTISKMEYYQNWFRNCDIIIKEVLSSLEPEARIIIEETLIYGHRYKEVCKKYNFSNPKKLFDYINTNLAQALNKTYF